MLVTLLIILAVFLALVGAIIGMYNKLVRLRALTKEAFSGITVQLRRRADLIPNLVETVQGYAAHEKGTLAQVTEMRRQIGAGNSVESTAAADAMMTGMIGRLLAVAENYPDLKANTNFLELQSELSGIEGELQMARRYYNATARDLNTAVESFPSGIVASITNFKQEPYYEDADPAIQSAPKVSFAKPEA